MQPNSYGNDGWKSVPPPGSDEALEQMCVCPRMDNNYGAGDMGLFWVNSDCPLHGTESKKLEAESPDE